MARARRPSPQTILVLGALNADPAAWRYGYDLAAEVGLKSGSLYPILIRLAEREILETAWEQDRAPGRPPRHLYRLTATGQRFAAACAPPASERATRSPRRVRRQQTA
jgi:DNA-binding PadR family transcriptional regulator